MMRAIDPPPLKWSNSKYGFGPEEARKSLFVFAKGHIVPPARVGELARQHVCSRYRKG